MVDGSWQLVECQIMCCLSAMEFKAVLTAKIELILCELVPKLNHMTHKGGLIPPLPPKRILTPNDTQIKRNGHMPAGRFQCARASHNLLVNKPS